MSYDNSDKYLGASIAAGDFDGDGKQEVAVIYLSPQKDSYYAERSLTADVVKYRTSSRRWDRSSQVLLTVRVSSNGYSYYSNSKTDWSKPSTLLPTKADFDGDGKDEIALLTFIGDRGSESDSPSIIRLYCDRNSIQFKYDGTMSRYNDSCLKELSFELGSNYVNHSRRDYLRRVSITAGPVVGTMGKYKLADDIVISCVLGDRYNYSKYYRKIFVFSPTFWDNYNYIELNSRTIYNQSITAGNYGMSLPVCSVITGDFAHESLQLAKPVHTLDDTDKSYTTVLQAMPYHVDNVDINGNLTTDPINYTFSGFKGDSGSGKMRVAYTKTDSNSTTNDVTFNMASTTETISLLGDAGPYVHGYLKFRTMQANIAGNFDERAKAAAETMNTIMDLVTDKIDETTTKSTSEAKQIYTADTFDALLWDRMVSYSAQQHIWRYKILNNPLPSWYKLGAKADYSSRKTNADDEHFLTFAIYDTATPSKTVSNQDNEYQPRHEEGNFFSYPSDIVYSEGYHEAGKLRETNQWVTWTKGGDSSTTLGFEEAKIESQKYEDNVSESELTKTVSAIATFFGADDPNPLPPYSSHSETFSKKLAKSEQIDVELYGRGDVPGEEAAHSIMTVPYIAKEGTLKVAHAVRLDTSTSRLWGNNSRYRKFADPALVLPGKYNRYNASIVTNDNNASAMQMRGVRFYVPDLDLHSNSNLLAGLTYKVKVPIYNASFKNTGNFSVKLSYMSANTFDTSAPNKSINSLTAIQTITMSLGGWDNNKSNNNKGWAEFTWAVPRSITTGDYVLFAQIDPEKGLAEAHESRLDSSGKIVDVGGNNEGYIKIHVMSESDAQNAARQHVVKASSLTPRALTPRGTIYRAVSRNANASGMFSTAKGVGSISTNVTFGNTEGLDLNGLVEVFSDEGYQDPNAPKRGGGSAEGIIKASTDVSYPVVIDVRYDGEEYYPEAYLRGYNYKAGTQEVDHVFLNYRLALVPHTTTQVVFNLDKSCMDYENGTGFEIVVPEIEAEAVREEIANSVEITERDTTEENTSDEDNNTDTETQNVSDSGSSSGGCNTFAGSVAVLGLAGLVFSRRRKLH